MEGRVRLAQLQALHWFVMRLCMLPMLGTHQLWLENIHLMVAVLPECWQWYVFTMYDSVCTVYSIEGCCTCFCTYTPQKLSSKISKSKIVSSPNFAGVSCVIFDFFNVLSKMSVVFTVRRCALHGLSHRNSVHPSVSLPVTLMDCFHMVQPTIMISPMIVLFTDIRFIQKFEGGHPERGHWMRLG